MMTGSDAREASRCAGWLRGKARRLQTSYQPVVCEICGRSLLRGEHATTFRDGPARHSVCELCTGRAFGEDGFARAPALADPAKSRTVRARCW